MTAITSEKNKKKKVSKELISKKCWDNRIQDFQN